MPEKAQRIMQKMRGRLNNPRKRDRVLDEFNRSTLDEVGPVASDKGEKFLCELKELADLEGEAGRIDPGR